MIGILGALVGATGFGTANVVIKKSLADLSIAQTLTMATASGVFCLSLLVFFTGGFTAISWPTLLAAAGLAVTEVVLYLILYKTFSVSTVSVATAVAGSYPILSLLFTVLVFSETVEVHKMLYIGLLVVGAIITSIDWNGVLRDGLDKKDIVKGWPWILATTLIHAMYYPFLGQFTSNGDWELKLLLIKAISLVLLVIVFAMFRRESITPPHRLMPMTALLGLLEVIGWAGFSWATSVTVGQTAVLIATMNSSALVTAVLAYFFLKEKLSVPQYLGIMLIIASLTGLSTQ